jgi:hypothetical protein
VRRLQAPVEAVHDVLKARGRREPQQLTITVRVHSSSSAQSTAPTTHHAVACGAVEGTF